MKKMKPFLLIIMFMLLLSSCSAVNTTEELFESSTPTASIGEQSLPELSLEELKTLKEELSALNNTAETRFLNGDRAKKVLEECYNGKPEDYMKDQRVFSEVLMSDIDSESYPCKEDVQKLKEGMYPNEVAKVLGRPHFSSRYASITMMVHPYDCAYDAYTVYVMDDGQIMLLQYIPFFYEKYDRAELIARIPEYEYIETLAKDGYYRTERWVQLHKVSIITVEELTAMRIDNEFMQTAEENRPLCTREDFAKIKEGMTYEEVVTATGAAGYEYQVTEGIYRYLWMCPDRGSVWVIFTMNAENNLIVSQIGICQTLTVLYSKNP